MTEPDVSSLISAARAIEIIDAAPVQPRTLRAKLIDAQGLRLAQDILADRDAPAFDKSQMDGYAVRASDVTSQSARLVCVGEIAAGHMRDMPLRAGETVAIMTGAPLPAGADAVIPVEMSRKTGDGAVVLTGPAVAGKFIAKRASEYRAGDLLLRSGVKLEAAQLALAASVGAAEVDVFARPRVAILSTGDEIVPFDQSPGPGQIRNSNSIMLASLLRRLGCEVADLGTACDDPGAIRSAIERGMRFDVLFITGGMSMGEHDYVPGILREIGVDLKITKVRIKPGKPFVFAARTSRDRDGADGAVVTQVFGLPGNPVSGFACVLRLCSRLLMRLAGGVPGNDIRTAPLASPLEPNGPREFYQPASFDPDGKIRPLVWKSSADVYTLSQAGALVIRAEHEPALRAGDLVRFVEIPR